MSSIRKDVVLVTGLPASPYTRKVLAALRYRRIEHRFLSGGRAAANLPRPPIALMPAVYFPDGSGDYEVAIDSTPILRRLEACCASRALVPDDPGLAMIDALVEDYADEWLTKALFHFRWGHAADARSAAPIIASLSDGVSGADDLRASADAFAARQIARLEIVGSNGVTAPAIERSYERFLVILERHLALSPFLFGERPATADFALFGQLSQLALFDPTPRALATAIAPRTIAWTLSLEDASGLPDDAAWAPLSALAPTIGELLGEIGRTYAPFMVANAAALDAGSARVRAHVDGVDWEQPAFPYQRKCLVELRRRYDALAPAGRAAVDELLDGTGCLILFDGPSAMPI